MVSEVKGIHKYRGRSILTVFFLFVNANRSEAQQSSNIASGSSSSSATMASFQIPPPDILELEGSTASN